MITQMGFFVDEEYTSCSLYCIPYSYSLFIFVWGGLLLGAVVLLCGDARWLGWNGNPRLGLHVFPIVNG